MTGSGGWMDNKQAGNDVDPQRLAFPFNLTYWLNQRLEIVLESFNHSLTGVED